MILEIRSYTQMRSRKFAPRTQPLLPLVSTTTTKMEISNWRRERIKAMKRMSPKVAVSSEMWLRVARSIDKVDSMVQRGIGLLDYRNEDGTRITDISKEIVEWRAFLRTSQYLRLKKLVNTNGEALNPALINLKLTMKAKRLEFYTKAKTTPLQNIRYDNLTVSSSDLAKEIAPYEVNFD